MRWQNQTTDLKATHQMASKLDTDGESLYRMKKQVFIDALGPKYGSRMYSSLMRSPYGYVSYVLIKRKILFFQAQNHLFERKSFKLITFRLADTGQNWP